MNKETFNFQTNAPPAFHVMVKPTGADCNLNCEYCFFLKKNKLYPDSKFRMSDEVHDAYITQLIAAHKVPRITVAWQGGEPTLMRLDFYKRSIIFQKNHAKEGTVFLGTPDGEPGLNYLCEAYKFFFQHADRSMKIMADLIRRGKSAADIMKLNTHEKREGEKEKNIKLGRNAPYYCGSGQKFKNCHGKQVKPLI